MGRRKAGTSLGVMYIDDSKKRTLVDKLQWMTSAYVDRLGIKPKILCITHEDAEQVNLEEIKGVQVHILGRPLRPHHFVLCQKLEDYLIKKEEKNAT